MLEFLDFMDVGFIDMELLFHIVYFRPERVVEVLGME